MSKTATKLKAKEDVLIEQRNLTWNDLAAIYQKATGLKASILPMGALWRWAMDQKGRFYVDEEGALHLLVQK